MKVLLRLRYLLKGNTNSVFLQYNWCWLLCRMFFTELTEAYCVSHPAFNLMDIEGTTLSRQLFVWRKMHGTTANLPLVQTKSRQLGLLSSNINLLVFPGFSASPHITVFKLHCSVLIFLKKL